LQGLQKGKMGKVNILVFFMRLKRLELKSFRNYKNLELDFTDDISKILIIGDNGQGKTNLLESIYMLSVAKSFRSKKSSDLLAWKAEYTRIKGVIKKKEEDICLEVFLSQPKKATKKNDLIIPGNNFMGILNVVLFHPQDMNLLLLSPDLRRKYLDLLASQTDRDYLQALIRYRKVLKSRNQLLGQIQNDRANENECFFWDQELVRSGSILVKKRQEIVDYLNERLTDIYRKISDEKEKLRVKYNNFADRNMQIEELESYFSARLLEKKNSDLRSGYTSVGPHRDDIKFFLDGKEFETHGSRGECRTLLISLKLAEIQFIQDNTGEIPILLLDDVFSELDAHRQEKLLLAVDGCQTFITGTSSNKLEENLGTCKLIVEKGRIK